MKLKKVVAAGLSVLLLQTLMEPSMQFVAFGMDESVAIDNDGISSDIMEADDENLNLDALPDDLRNRFSEELQNAVKLWHSQKILHTLDNRSIIELRGDDYVT